MSTCEVERVCDPRQFDALAPAWAVLCTAAGIENVFLTHRWLSEWWRVYGAGRDLWTLVVRDGSRIAGIAPLVLERTFVGGPRFVRFMGAGEVTPNHLDVIAAPGDRGAVLCAIWAWLTRNRSAWDLLSLEGMAGDSPSAGLLSDLFRATGSALRARVSEVCPYAVLPPSFEEFIQSRGSRTSSRLRYRQRRLERDFPGARFADVASPEEFAEVFEAFLRLHQARWSKRGQRDSFSSSRLVLFHRAVARAAFDNRTVRLYHLRLGGTVAAVFYCFRVGSRLTYYNAGFDDGYGKYSLGILTLAYAIGQGIAEGAKEFDFLQGEEDYKRQWANAQRVNLRIATHAPHARGRLAWLGYVADERLRDAAKTLLSRETRRRIRHLARKP